VNAVQHILIFGVRVYRWVLSPLKGILFGPLGRCRFEPTCSAYAGEAIYRHGAMKGCWLAIKRVSRCHPWGGCGHDPVPGKTVSAIEPESPQRCLSYPLIRPAKLAIKPSRG